MLIHSGSRAAHRYADAIDARWIELDAPPLSLREQWELRRIGRVGRLFWATSLAHQLLGTQPTFVTIHDLAQVFGGRAVGSRYVGLAASLYLRSLLRTAVGIACVSSFTLDQVRRFHGRAIAVPTGVTPLGVAQDWRRATYATARRAPHFIFIGNIRRHKNIATLLRAFRMVASSIPEDLVIVGNAGVMDDEAKALLCSLSETFPRRVTLAGFLPQEQLIALTAGATALVFPSRYEGFGLPPLEAMAAGCPVLASAVTAIPEVCGDAARYFDPESSSELAALMIEYSRMDGQTRRAVVANGIERSAGFTWERCADLTAELLLRSISRMREQR